MITISRLGIVPLEYDRLTPEAYGNFELSAARAEQVDILFGARCETAFNALWSKHPLGTPRAILHAGFFAAKPGEHGTGEAFDLDGIVWPDERIFTVQDEGMSLHGLGIQAHLYMYFGVMLNEHHSAAHADHFHLDSSRPVGYRNSSSLNMTIQHMLNEVYGYELDVDGDFGPKTRKAVTDVQSEQGLVGGQSLYSLLEWNEFMEKTRDLAFARGIHKTLSEPASDNTDSHNVIKIMTTRQQEIEDLVVVQSQDLERLRELLGVRM